MKYANPTDHESRHSVKVLAIFIVVGIGAAIGIGVYGLFFAGQQGEPTVIPTVIPTLTERPATPTPTSKPAPTSTDPEAFARWAVTTLFAWDTATMNPVDVTDTLMAVADPLGEESAGLASDIGNYLPDSQTWVKLRGYATRQWLDIQTVVIPEAWHQAETDTAPGQILPGTIAYTITGTRHREGVYADEPTSYTQTISFTMFVTCQPTFPECHLLRLSLPDEPLK